MSNAVVRTIVENIVNDKFETLKEDVSKAVSAKAVNVLENKKAVEVMIGGKPLDPEKTYTMVNSDYILDSGSGIPAFKTLKQNKSGYLMRDAIIQYCQHLQSTGKKISLEPQKRITK